jgi:hypothetical protein
MRHLLNSGFGGVVVNTTKPSRKDGFGVRLSAGASAFFNPVVGVVSLCSKKQVSRIAAWRIIAAMADAQIARHVSVAEKVSQPVSREKLSIQGSNTVATAIGCTFPSPAGRFTSRFVQVFGKFLRSIFWSSHNQEATHRTESKARKLFAAISSMGGNNGDIAFQCRFKAVA